MTRKTSGFVIDDDQLFKMAGLLNPPDPASEPRQFISAYTIVLEEVWAKFGNRASFPSIIYPKGVEVCLLVVSSIEPYETDYREAEKKVVASKWLKERFGCENLEYITTWL